MPPETSLSISEASNAIPGLWYFATGLRRDYINRNGFLYACDFEARLNLDIIDAIVMEKVNGTAGFPAFSALVNSFETKATLSVIAGCDRRSYRRLSKLLKKHWTPLDRKFEDEIDNPTVEESVENALENFSFVVRKIETLKRIIPVACKDASFLKGFYLDRRLGNIKTALRGMHNCLKKVIEAEEK